MEMNLNGITRGIIQQELPWLLARLPSSVQVLEVRGMDLDTLSLSPGVSFGLHGVASASGCVFLLSREGLELVRVGWFTRTETTFWKKREFQVGYWEEETVEQALIRFSELADQVRYVLHLLGSKATLYRVPYKEESISTWLVEEVRRARSSLHFTLHKDWDW